MSDEEVNIEEAALEEPTIPVNPQIPYFGYGAATLWSAIAGYLIYSWYPYVIRTDPWW